MQLNKPYSLLAWHKTCYVSWYGGYMMLKIVKMYGGKEAVSVMKCFDTQDISEVFSFMLDFGVSASTIGDVALRVEKALRSDSYLEISMPLV